MKNSFNIEVNFKPVPLKPFEWDNISFINGIKVVRVSSKCIHDFLLYDCIMPFKNKIILFSDTRDSIVIKTDKNGKISGRSFLLFDRDLEVSEFSINIKPIKIDYVTKNKLKYSLILEEEKKIKDYLVETIEKIKDENEIEYLYYLYFNDFKGYSKEKLLNSIKNNYSLKYFELYKFMSKN